MDVALLAVRAKSAPSQRCVAEQEEEFESLKLLSLVGSTGNGDEQLEKKTTTSGNAKTAVLGINYVTSCVPSKATNHRHDSQWGLRESKDARVVRRTAETHPDLIDGFSSCPAQVQ